MIYKGRVLAFAAFSFGLVLFMASLWQLELVTGFYVGDEFHFPFYLWTVNRWWARDFWYATLMVSLILCTISASILVFLKTFEV